MTMLSTTLANLTFQSPIMNASGCFNPTLFHQMSPLDQCLGAIVTKTVTQSPRSGNPQQRTVELPGVGMLNSIGLQNPGLGVVMAKDVPQFYNLSSGTTPIILSIAATDVDAFGEMVTAIDAHEHGSKVVAYELNLSCPNVAKGGVDFGVNPELITRITQCVAVATKKPFFAKLTPNVASVVPLAQAAQAGGAHGVTLINTVLGTAIDLKTKKPYLPRVSGGYSGPGIKPVALHHVFQVHQALPEFPIIGVGGIQNASDVIEFTLAGASCVQVGTACFPNPMVFSQLIEDLRSWCEHEGVSSWADVVGAAHQQSMTV